MLLTPEQIFVIRQIIEDYHTAFVVNAISPDAVPPEVLQKLKDMGLIDPKAESVKDAYLYGQLVGILENKAVGNMGFAQFQKYVKQNPVPLTPVENQAIKFAQLNAAQYCKGLGNKVSLKTGDVLIEADAALRAKMRDTIQTKTAEAIAKRQTVSELKSELGWATDDWARDWNRISVTEKQSAMQRGLADQYRKKHGEGVLVAKRPMPDACKHCKRLHIGPDGQPRIFKLSTLEANGTNVGKKAADWQAVVGTVHPNCQCQMVRIPKGWGFDEHGDLVPGGEYGQHYENESDMELALSEERDLQKSFQLQGHMVFQGIPIAIENRKGSVRKWKDAEGNTGQTKMTYAYGYVKRTLGTDEDEVDCFIGPDPRAANAFIVHQQNKPQGTYDEEKVMLGFSNQKEAVRAYRENFDVPDDFFVTVSPMGLEDFKRYVSGTQPKSENGGKVLRKGCESRHVVPRNRMLSPKPVIPLDSGKSRAYTPNSPIRGEARHAVPRNRMLSSKPVISLDSGKSGTCAPNSIVRGEFRHAVPRNDVPGNLEKGKLHPEIGALTSPASGRAPGPGVGVNHFIPPAKREEKQKRDVDVDWTELTPDEKVHDGDPLKKKPEDLEFESPFPVEPRPVTAPDGWRTAHKQAREGAEERKERFVLRYTENKGKPNKELAKSKQPILFIGKKGGKVVGKTAKGKLIYQRNEDDVNAIGAKVVPGKKEGTTTIKTPKHNKQALIDFQKKNNWPGEVFEGGVNAILIVPTELVAKVVKGKKKAKAPKVIPPTVSFAGDSERSEDLHTVENLDSLQEPKVDPNHLFRGQAVTVKVGGEIHKGTLLGTDQAGDPIVESGGKRYEATWNNVRPKDGKPTPYQSIMKSLPKGALVAPTKRQKDLLRKTIDELKVCGNHTADEFIDWLWDHGQESFIVGGLVRDLLETTKPEQDVPDEDILELMKDVDIVTTADPRKTDKMLTSIGHDVMQYYKDGGKAWGVLRFVGGGAGLDVATMAQEGMFGPAHPLPKVGIGEVGPKAVLDHDMEADCNRRDFTCNSVFYDPVNDLFVDPTTKGIADAQQRILRLACTEEEGAKNDTLSLRYFKFRMRGYTPTKETHAFCTKEFEKWAAGKAAKKFPGDSLGKAFFRAYGAKGGDPKKHMANLKKAMTADGISHVWEKYIQPNLPGILSYMQNHMQ